MNNYTVYKITAPNNKCYIGITSRKPEIRWSNGKGYSDVKSNHFYRAIQKYGWENFKHEILFENLNKEEACKKEIELIAEYKSNNPKFGYNLSLGGESGSYGYKHTPEQNKAKSERQLGKNHKPHSEEIKKKISLSKTGKPNPHSIEHIIKIANANRGKKRTFEQRQRIKNGRKDYTVSEKTKQKISNTMKGKKPSNICIQKSNEARRIKIYQYDKKLNFINSYNSMTEASKVINKSVCGISECCNNKRKYFGGYIWRKEKIDG